MYLQIFSLSTKGGIRLTTKFLCPLLNPLDFVQLLWPPCQQLGSHIFSNVIIFTLTFMQFRLLSLACRYGDAILEDFPQKKNYTKYHKREISLRFSCGLLCLGLPCNCGKKKRSHKQNRQSNKTDSLSQ